MTQIEFIQDPKRMVPIPAREFSDAERVAWAAQEAKTLSDSHELDERRRDAIEAAFQVVYQDALSSEGMTVLIFDPLTHLVAPLRLQAIARPFTQAEQQTFMRSTGPLAGQMRLTPETSFGVGCSLAFPSPRQGFAEVRWLFVASDVTLVAVLAPASQAATLSMGVTVEDLLSTLRVDGVEERPSGAFDPARLVREAMHGQAEWSI